MEVRIDPEFKSLIPTLSPEELEGLGKSIVDEGCREPLILWDDILIDGHHRYEICQQHEIKFKTIQKGFDNRDQVKVWIIANQLSRRNLSPEQVSYLRGAHYNIEEKKPGERTDLTSSQNETKSDKAEKIAKKYGVSRATIHRDKKFTKAVDALPEEEKKAVLSGKTMKSKKEIVREHEAKASPSRNENEGKKEKKEKREEKKSSEALRYLMVWWKKAKPADRKYFLEWIKEEETMNPKFNGGDGNRGIDEH